MGAADQVQVVSAQELGHHVFTKGERDAAVVLAPTNDVLVGVCPQQIAEESRVRYVCTSSYIRSGPVSVLRWEILACRSHDSLDLLHVQQLGA